jgi:hypothetical protein
VMVKIRIKSNSEQNSTKRQVKVDDGCHHPIGASRGTDLHRYNTSLEPTITIPGRHQFFDVPCHPSLPPPSDKGGLSQRPQVRIRSLAKHGVLVNLLKRGSCINQS